MKKNGFLIKESWLDFFNLEDVPVLNIEDSLLGIELSEVDYRSWLKTEINKGKEIFQLLQPIAITLLEGQDFALLATYASDFRLICIAEEIEQLKPILWHDYPLFDGVSHINIYSQSHCELGRMLSNFYPSDFEVEEGRFKSIEGYWFWLQTGDNRLKGLTGYKARKLGKDLLKDRPEVFIEGFNDKIKAAIQLKIEANTYLKHTFTQSKLPFRHYYYFGNMPKVKVHRLKQHEWLLSYFEALRSSYQKTFIEAV